MSRILEVQGLWKRYADVDVVKGVSLDLRRGEVKVIIGPSGSGKSTLLRCVALLEPFDAGSVTIEGEPVSWPGGSGAYRATFSDPLVRTRARLGVVFQSFNLFPHLTALQNVSLGPRVVRRWGRRQAEDTARSLLSDVGLGGRLDAYPHELSGGQQQRVAIARALAMEPTMLLLDEPTAALDAELTREVLDVLLRLARQGVTMLAVTHALGFAKAVAHEVIMMDRGEIVETAPPQTFFTSPRQDRVRRFLERVRE